MSLKSLTQAQHVAMCMRGYTPDMYYVLTLSPWLMQSTPTQAYGMTRTHTQMRELKRREREWERNEETER